MQQAVHPPEDITHTTVGALLGGDVVLHLPFQHPLNEEAADRLKQEASSATAEEHWNSPAEGKEARLKPPARHVEWIQGLHRWL